MGTSDRPTPARLLLVDDSPVARRVLGHVLRTAGYEVREAPDGREALESLTREPWDVVLSDLQMPGIDGFAVLQAAKFCDPGLEVILITGVYADDTEAIVLALRLGASDFLSKASSPDQVLGSVGRALDRRRELQELKRAESALRRSERAYQELVESVKAVVWRADARTFRFSFVGGVAETLLGYPAEEWTSRPSFWVDHVHPEDRDWVVALCKGATEPMQPHEFEYRMIAADGRVVWLRDTVRVLAEEGRPSELVGVMVDITEKKRAEEHVRQSEERLRQGQKMEAIGRLAGGVAHDFNNHLTAILGYGDMVLRRLGPDDPQRVRVEEIRKAAERAAVLTHQLLAFGRKQVLQPRILDLNELVMGVAGMLRRLIGEDVQLVTVLRDGLGYVKADPGQLEQVLMNLAVNARDAMPHGGVLTIETADAELEDSFVSDHPGALPGRYVMLVVGDTGTGMDAETRKHIFEPFFTTKEPGKGTGLGLATVYGIVKQSGGYIAVVSRPGEGTVFDLYFPRADEPLDRAAGAAAEAALPSGSETILLAEDEEAVRRVARDALQGSGYTVIEAPTGVAALEAAEHYRGRIDLVLADVVMPRMNGWVLWERVAAVRPEARVLLMSGHAAEALAGVLREGVPLLRKPFDATALLGKVREILDGADGSRPARS